MSPVHALLEVLRESFRDTLPLVPLLFALYVGLEMAVRGGSVRLARLARHADAAGPAAGALLGVVPQCGMSVFMSTLFLSGRISRGTLVATYIATSDEALPVLIAHGNQGRLVLAILAWKVVIGAGAGVLVDRLVRPRYHRAATPAAAGQPPEVERELHRADVLHLAKHALGRTLHIFAWVLAITVVIGLVLRAFGATVLPESIARHPWIAVVAVAVFGLIPNCAASIAIAEGAVRGLLPFGAVIAGLSAGAGFGPIVLLKDGSVRTAAQLLAICLAIAVVAGLGFTLAGAWRP